MTKFVKSNEAVVMGALYAGCELYFGYPITPASEIAHGAAKWFPMLGRTFVRVVALLRIYVAEPRAGTIHVDYHCRQFRTGQIGDALLHQSHTRT